MSYTKQQLIDAQHEYNLRWKENPSEFATLEDAVFDITEDNKSIAENQINYLISIIEGK